MKRRVLYVKHGKILTEKLEQMLLEVKFEPMIRGTPPGCVCKKCFMAVKSFYDRKTQLLKNLDAAINKMPCNARPIPSSAELEGTPTRGRKRACQCLSDHEEHRRLSSFNRTDSPFHQPLPVLALSQCLLEFRQVVSVYVIELACYAVL